MNVLLGFEKQLSRAIEFLITVFFFVILCLTVLLVLLRYGFNSSIIWGSEAMNYLFIYTTALGAALSVGKGTHIRISFLIDMTKGRLRKIMDCLVYLFIGGINAVLGWYSLPWIKTVGSFESPVMRIPIWLVHMSVPLGCFLAVAYSLLHITYIVFGVDTSSEGEGN